MNGKRTIEALMATALYETLSEADQAQLDRALQANPTLRAEYDALRKMVAAMPTATPEFTGDLSPVLHEQLSQSRPRRRFRYARLIPRVAAPLLLMAFMGNYLLQNVRNDHADPSTEIAHTAAVALQDPFTTIFETVDDLVTRRKYEQASTLLQESLGRFPEALSAGKAQERFATLNFHHLRRYDVALDAYATLRANYADTFSNSPDSINRYDLLVEVEPADFAPLLALDKAREQGGDTFVAVEKVLASQLPDSMMAQQTLLALQDTVAADLPEGATTVAMLEEIQKRCTAPTAKGQVNLALAQRYWTDDQDVDRARLLYQDIIATAPPQFAQLAKDTLARLPE